MQMLMQNVRPMVYAAAALLLFIFLIVAMTVHTITISGPFIGSVSYSIFDGDTSSGGDSCLDKVASMVKASRAFLILAILGTLPAFAVAGLDALKKTSILGPAAPFFKFIMAGVAGYMVFCLLIAWPIMMALPSNFLSCLPSGYGFDASISAAPIVALVAWLIAGAMIPVAIFAPPPPPGATPDGVVVPVAGIAVHPAATPWLPQQQQVQYQQPQYQPQYQQAQPQYQQQPQRAAAQPKLDDFL